MIRTAIIIAGGEGLRLLPLTNDKPKAMVEVKGKPLLYWDIQWLKSYGINHIVVGVAYRKDKIIKYLRENTNFGMKIDISEHTVEGGTAEAFNFAIKRFVPDENFVGMNCDELTNMSLSKLIELHESRRPLITMGLAPFHCRFSVVNFSDDSKVKDFQYGKKIDSLPISMGVYIFNRNIINQIAEKGSIEDTTFAKLVKKDQVIGRMLSKEEEWISINTVKDIEEAEILLGSWDTKRRKLDSRKKRDY